MNGSLVFVYQDFLNAAMQHLKLAVTPGNAIIRIAMGPEGTNFAFIELRSEDVGWVGGFVVVWRRNLGKEAFLSLSGYQ